MKIKNAFGKFLPVVLGVGITSVVHAADYTWTAAGTANWASANWAGTPTVDPAVGPTASDDIFFSQSLARTVSVAGADRYADTVSSFASAGWTFQGGVASTTTLLNANSLANYGSSTIQFRNGNTTALLNVELGDLILDGTSGATITGGGTAAAETATNYLNGISVSGETRIVQGTANFNVRNATNTSNTFSLGLLNVTAGAVNLNHSYATKNAVVNLRGLTGAGGTVTGATTIGGGTNTGTTSLVITATGQYSSGTVLSNGTSGGFLSLTKAGVGTQILTGTNTYTGGTTITGGRLQLGSGGQSGSITGNVALNGAGTEFAINRSDAYAFSGTISGDGQFIHAGTGTTTLSAANSYSGGTIVSAGSLLVTNTAGSATGSGNVTVAAARMLGGNGIIAPGAGNDVTISGVLSPGVGNEGVLTFGFSGDSKLDFASGSSIEMTLGTSSDKIAFQATGDWLSGSGNAALSLALGSGFSYDNSYVIFQGVSTSGFDFASVVGYNTSAYTHNFSQIGNDYVLSFTAVPEPGTLALCGIAAVVGLCVVRRNRAAA